jgi:hypothetical protein
VRSTSAKPRPHPLEQKTSDLFDLFAKDATPELASACKIEKSQNVLNRTLHVVYANEENYEISWQERAKIDNSKNTESYAPVVHANEENYQITCDGSEKHKKRHIWLASMA